MLKLTQKQSAVHVPKITAIAVLYCCSFFEDADFVSKKIFLSRKKLFLYVITFELIFVPPEKCDDKNLNFSQLSKNEGVRKWSVWQFWDN